MAAVALPAASEQFAQAGPVMTGVVKSWNSTKGFGFIVSEEVEGDVHFGKRDLPMDAREVHGNFLQGRPVTFELQVGPDGRAKATKVQLPALEGQPYAGTIKSYSEKNGYGFLTSSSLEEDVRFHRSDLPPNAPAAQMTGLSVTFDVLAMPDGKLRVNGMKLQNAPSMKAPMGAMGYGMPAAVMGGFGKGVQVPRPPAPVSFGGAMMLGVVKSYSERNGYGFINIPGQAGDIKFNKTDIPGGNIAAGTHVSFQLTAMPDGRAQANQVTPVDAMGAVKRPAPSTNLLTTPGPEKHRRVGTGAVVNLEEPVYGSVKSYNPQKGFGFISTQGIPEDIFFMRSELQGLGEEALQNRPVYFTVVQAPDGRLRAQSVCPA